jgi:hypothetical protein
MVISLASELRKMLIEAAFIEIINTYAVVTFTQPNIMAG